MDSFIERDNNPVYGTMQPSNGVDTQLKYVPMGRRRKIPIEPDAARRNITARLNLMFPRASGVTQQYLQLAKLSGVGEETIRKFMLGDSSMTLRNLTSIADSVGLTMSELFADEQPARKAGPPPAGDDAGSGILHPRRGL